MYTSICFEAKEKDRWIGGGGVGEGNEIALIMRGRDWCHKEDIVTASLECGVDGPSRSSAGEVLA